MPQVSRKFLPKDIEERMFRLFFDAFARISRPSDVAIFLQDLLGPVERIMLAKRLAIALLLRRGYDYGSIKQILRVSNETISRVNIALVHSGKGYKLVVDRILADKALNEFWERIEDILTSVIPPNRQFGKDLHRSKWSRKPRGLLD